MADLLRSEFYKLYKDPSFRILGFALCIVSVMISLLLRYMGPADAIYDGVAGIGYGMQVNMLALKIALAIFGGFFLTGEYALGVMKITAASGYGRERIYVSRLAAYVTGVVVLSLLVPGICAAMGSLMNGAGQVEGMRTGVYALRIMGLTALYAAAFASMIAALASTLTVSGVTIGATLLGLLFFDSLSGWLSGHWAAYKFVYDRSVFKLFLDMDMNIRSGEVWPLAIIVPVATIALFAWAGMLAFRRMEIK